MTDTPAEQALPTPDDLIRSRAEQERQLIRDEERAERQLATAKDRLARAQSKADRAIARLNRRQAKADKALEALRAAREARAIGPDGPVSPAALPAQFPPSQPARDDQMVPRELVTSARPVEDDEPSDPRPTRQRRPRAVEPPIGGV